MSEAKEFLKKYQMTSSDIDISEALKAFKLEIDKGLKKDGPISECSIPMIPTYLNPNVSPIENEKVIVVDAGGTNLRIGIGVYHNSDWEITDITEDKMPGITREYSKEEFFDYIASRMVPYLDKATNIGFCFSYRVQMDKSLDGKLIAWAKEIKAKEVVGEYVGASLLNAIKKYSSTKREIVVLNDTASVLLGGITLDNKKEFNKYIGVIYGTGFNCCYIEDVKNIIKLKDDISGSMIINTETGNFNGFNRGVFDTVLTNESLMKDEALTEKMSSGRYLSSLIYQATEKAIEDGLLKETKLIDKKDFNLPLVSMYLANVDNTLDKCFGNEREKEIFKDICLELINRASKIVATTISAFAIKSNEKKIGIIVEGSTFYKLFSFKESFENYLKEILNYYDIDYKLFNGLGRVLVGAAVASKCKTL